MEQSDRIDKLILSIYVTLMVIHLSIHSSTHSVNKYLLSTCSVSATVLGPENFGKHNTCVPYLYGLWSKEETGT